MTARRTGLLWFCAGVAVFLAVWALLARLLDSEILLPGPLATGEKFVVLVQSPRFLAALWHSFLRVMAGIAISVPLGIAAGCAAALDRRMEAFLRPFLAFVSATPVMAVILIVFLWLGSGLTPVFTSFLMVFPVMTANTRAAVQSVDPKLLELCRAFDICGLRRLRCLYLPAMLPQLLAGLKASLSLSWKVVAAAEVLVQPALALGTGMQNAKANLETSELFAWTLAAIIAAALCEAALGLLGSARARGSGVPKARSLI